MNKHLEYINVQNIHKNTKSRTIFSILKTVRNSIKVANLVLCGIVFVWFPDDDPLWIETCRNIRCNIMI